MAVELIGWAGAIALLAAYALLNDSRLTVTDHTYVALNLTGSAGLAVNACAHAAWPSLILNLLWLAVGISTLAALRGRTPLRRPHRPS